MASLNEESKAKVRLIAQRYPRKRSALLPALYVAQQQDGMVTDEAIADISELLDVSPADIKGVASFYTMYYHHPVGRYIFQVCGTLSCALCGAEEVLSFLEEKLGVGPGQTTADGKFMYEVVECLGACGTAPVMLFGDQYFENLTLEQLDKLIDDLRARPEDVLSAPQLAPYTK